MHKRTLATPHTHARTLARPHTHTRPLDRGTPAHPAGQRGWGGHLQPGPVLLARFNMGLGSGLNLNPNLSRTQIISVTLP